ncbi:lipase family protein [Bradyrhizobium sp. HKCCYLR20261]|uniref:lipase family protein n=1 Tax=Bradyrhizobium sp. HKCCYLR20261 TaxID=3420760 RepID=UPI003EBF1081
MPFNKNAAAYLSYYAYIDDALATVQANDFAQYLQAIPSGPANGPWSLCWGPAVNDGVLAYVAKGNDGSYGLAFRGTDVDGSVSGTFENIGADLEAFFTVPFLYPQQPLAAGAAQAQISSGLNGALALAIGLTDPVTDISLLDYLRGLAKSGPLDLTVTGHSLGGALAVAATAWLQDQLPKAGPVSFKLWPHTFAAPTMWNAAFATRFAQQFTYYSAVNSNDAVPMGWANLQTLQNTYPAPYPSLEHTDFSIYLAVLAVEAVVAKLGYTQIAASNPDVWAEPLQSAAAWTDEAGLMHSMQNVYFKHVIGTVGPNLPGTTTTGIARPRAVAVAA